MLNPETSAASLLESLGRREVIPVDPVRLAVSFGLKVIETHMPQGISSSIIKDPGADAVIIISSDCSTHRKRVACAIELGKYAYATEMGLVSYEYCTMNAGAAPSLDVDIFAEVFAAHLLIPEWLWRGEDLCPEAFLTILAKYGITEEILAVRFGQRGSACESDAPRIDNGVPMSIQGNITRWWNDFDQEKYICRECMSTHGEREVRNLLNEGCTDGREYFYGFRTAPSHPFMMEGEGCALCDTPLHPLPIQNTSLS